MNTVDMLAGGDVTKYEDVYQQPNASTFVKRLRNRHLDYYNRTLSKILNPKKSDA